MTSGRLADHVLASVKRVRVGTLNPPKLAAVRDALRAFAPDVEVEGVAVDSGVSEQPIGFEEIVRGARNRASRATLGARCDLAVGIEDGLVPLPAHGVAELSHLNIGCAAITDGRRTSIGFSSAFAYPPGCIDPAVRDREPIGEVFDRMWNQRRATGSTASSSALSVGNIGRLSDGVLPRSEYARHGVLCALVAFLQPDLYGFDEDS